MRNINCKLPLAGCNPQSEIYNLDSLAGVLAQLVERLNGIEEVTGSNPVGSIPFCFQSGGDCEAGNSTGTLTQPVFNELARLIRDRLSDTNYTHSQSPLLFFSRKPHECLSGAAPEFLCRASPDIRGVSVDAIRHRQFTKSSFVADYADYNERK
jgi:hypothetical protein